MIFILVMNHFWRQLDSVGAYNNLSHKLTFFKLELSRAHTLRAQCIMYCRAVHVMQYHTIHRRPLPTYLSCSAHEQKAHASRVGAVGKRQTYRPMVNSI